MVRTEIELNIYKVKKFCLMSSFLNYKPFEIAKNSDIYLSKKLNPPLIEENIYEEYEVPEDPEDPFAKKLEYAEMFTSSIRILGEIKTIFSHISLEIKDYDLSDFDELKDNFNVDSYKTLVDNKKYDFATICAYILNNNVSFDLDFFISFEQWFDIMKTEEISLFLWVCISTIPSSLLSISFIDVVLYILNEAFAKVGEDFYFIGCLYSLSKICHADMIYANLFLKSKITSELMQNFTNAYKSFQNNDQHILFLSFIKKLCSMGKASAINIISPYLDFFIDLFEHTGPPDPYSFIINQYSIKIICEIIYYNDQLHNSDIINSLIQCYSEQPLKVKKLIIRNLVKSLTFIDQYEGIDFELLIESIFIDYVNRHISQDVLLLYNTLKNKKVFDATNIKDPFTDILIHHNLLDAFEESSL